MPAEPYRQDVLAHLWMIETLITTVMVFVFTAAAAIFFLVVDFVIRTGMSTILSFLR